MLDINGVKTLTDVEMQQVAKIINDINVSGYGKDKIYEIDLSTANTDKEFNIAGDTMIFLNVPNTVYVKFQDKEAYEIGLPIQNPIGVYKKPSWNKFYLTNTAYAGTSKLKVWIGFGFDLSFVNIQPSLMELVTTSTALGLSPSYTSSAFLVNNMKDLRFMVMSDANGELHIEFSPDGTNWDYDVAYSISAGVGYANIQNILADYVRVRYVNSGTQTVFRLSAKARS